MSLALELSRSAFGRFEGAVSENGKRTEPVRYLALPPMLPPRGLSREAAAAYVGVSATKFDQLVADSRMPHPKRVDGRRIWDRLALDAAFDALSDIGRRATTPNPWDRA